MSQACIPCGRLFHDECGNPGDEGCCCSNRQISSEGTSSREDRRKSTGEGLESGLSDSDATEQYREKVVTESAGRKRAAVMYPVDSDLACEWQNLANCGGGFVPIIGCLTGRQTHIHHGPDKTTVNNERGNISLICTPCHNRWHAKNDPLYGDSKCPDGIQPKQPRPMTPHEMIERAGAM